MEGLEFTLSVKLKNCRLTQLRWAQYAGNVVPQYFSTYWSKCYSNKRSPRWRHTPLF